MESTGVHLDPAGCVICVCDRRHHCTRVLIFRIAGRIVWDQTIVDRGTHISSGCELAAETRHLALIAEKKPTTVDGDHYRTLPASCRRIRLVQIKKECPFREVRLAHFTAAELKVADYLHLKLRILEKGSCPGGKGRHPENEKTSRCNN